MIISSEGYFLTISLINADADVHDPKQKHQELHTSERTIVPRTVIFCIWTLVLCTISKEGVASWERAVLVIRHPTVVICRTGCKFKGNAAQRLLNPAPTRFTRASSACNCPPLFGATSSLVINTTRALQWCHHVKLKRGQMRHKQIC